jgi:hypothetical protein
MKSNSSITDIETKAKHLIDELNSGKKITMDSNITHIDAKVIRELLNKLDDPRTVNYQEEIDLLMSPF